jgi:hypothetical protein
MQRQNGKHVGVVEESSFQATHHAVSEAHHIVSVECTYTNAAIPMDRQQLDDRSYFEVGESPDL